MMKISTLIAFLFVAASPLAYSWPEEVELRVGQFSHGYQLPDGVQRVFIENDMGDFSIEETDGHSIFIEGSYTGKPGARLVITIEKGAYIVRMVRPPAFRSTEQVKASGKSLSRDDLADLAKSGHESIEESPDGDVVIDGFVKIGKGVNISLGQGVSFASDKSAVSRVVVKVPRGTTILAQHPCSASFDQQ